MRRLLILVLFLTGGALFTVRSASAYPDTPAVLQQYVGGPAQSWHPFNGGPAWEYNGPKATLTALTCTVLHAPGGPYKPGQSVETVVATLYPADDCQPMGGFAFEPAMPIPSFPVGGCPEGDWWMAKFVGGEQGGWRQLEQGVWVYSGRWAYMSAPYSLDELHTGEGFFIRSQGNGRDGAQVLIKGSTTMVFSKFCRL